MESTQAAQAVEVRQGRSFPEEFRAVWARLENKGVFFVLLAAWLALFTFLGSSTFGYFDSPSIFYWLYRVYNHPDSGDSHGNLIPFVVLALFWWKREELLRIPQRTWWPGLLILGLAAVLHFIGYLIQQPRVSVVALILGGYALIGTAWGPGWMKGSCFPFILFLFCVPMEVVLDEVTWPLRLFCAWITYVFCHDMLGVSLIRQGTQLIDPAGQFDFDVAAACSGIRSLISLIALTGIYAMVFLRSPWRRLAVFSSAVPLSLLCNVLRLVFVIMATVFFGKAAGHFVHEWFGFLTYAIALGGASLLVGWLRESDHRASAARHP